MIEGHQLGWNLRGWPAPCWGQTAPPTPLGRVSPLGVSSAHLLGGEPALTSGEDRVLPARALQAPQLFPPCSALRGPSHI